MTENKGDLISREALIKKLEEMANNEWNIQVGSSKGLEDAIDVTENAPTVEPICNQIAWEQGYEAGLAQGKSERPQGEWIRTGLYGQTCLECNKCGKADFDIKYDNFCPKCGAKMQKGGNR